MNLIFYPYLRICAKSRDNDYGPINNTPATSTKFSKNNWEGSLNLSNIKCLLCYWSDYSLKNNHNIQLKSSTSYFSSGLILLSFGIEIASFMVMLTNCLRYFAADATADIILLYPKLTCSILTIMDYFSFIWLGVSLATLVFFRALREYQPNIYISMNHDRLSLVLNLGSLVLIASAILVQVQVNFSSIYYIQNLIKSTC